MSSSIEEILSRCRACSPVYKPGEGAVLRDLRGPIDTAFDQKRPPTFRMPGACWCHHGPYSVLFRP